MNCMQRYSKKTEDRARHRSKSHHVHFCNNLNSLSARHRCELGCKLLELTLGLLAALTEARRKVTLPT